MSRVRELRSLARPEIVFLLTFVLVAFTLDLALMDIVRDWLARTLGSIAVGSVVAALMKLIVVRSQALDGHIGRER